MVFFTSKYYSYYIITSPLLYKFLYKIFINVSKLCVLLPKAASEKKGDGKKFPRAYASLGAQRNNNVYYLILFTYSHLLKFS